MAKVLFHLILILIPSFLVLLLIIRWSTKEQKEIENETNNDWENRQW